MATARKSDDPSAPDPAAEMVARAAATPALKRRMGKKSGVALDHATPSSWAFLCAVAARHHGKRRPWILCPDIKTQERVHAELNATWGVRARFFPEQETSTFLDAVPDPDLAAERLSVLHEIRVHDPSQPVVLLETSMDEDVPSPDELAKEERELAVDEEVDLEGFVAALEDAGYERSPQVAERGQFSVRGGIIDVFSWQDAVPLRIELFDITIESLRNFDIHTQTSLAQLRRASVLLTRPPEAADADARWSKLGDLTNARRDLVIALGPPHEASHRCDLRILEGAASDGTEDFSTACHESPLGGFEAGDFVLQAAKRETFTRQLAEWENDGWKSVMVFNNAGEIQRFEELAAADPDTGQRIGKSLAFATGLLSRGFTLPAAKLAALSDAEVFGRYQHSRARRRFNRESNATARRAAADLRDISEDDVVVHLDYGIARYRGLQRQEAREEDGAEEDVLVLEFAEKAKLFVPLQQAHLVSRYVGAGKTNPPLSKLGEAKWARARQAAEKSIEDYAAQLLGIQAQRETLESYAHPPDTKWQLEFENSFLFKETPDQLRAIEEAKRDMENERPMDRLICGDVGFGKTEVAIRAAFKAVMGGKQVAILVPTTVLAQQHYENFRERMSDYPVKVELLSRFRRPAQQRKTVQGLLDGSVDIVVGTHRVISKDVAYKDLGLVVIDEEQRFGVKHKEKFKDLFRLVDVLTLSATPIPRTLYLSLMGARDMSTIETPPPNRIPVHTSICGYDERVIRQVIEREVARGGQVYFLHNRVSSIGMMKRKIEKLCPGVRVLIGHGQMEEGVLEEVMHAFVRGEADVLLCTTIIESGVDIPNANTILIDRADRFGLADLYQLRGRVGRAGTRAYAVLMLPRDLMGATGDARRRINAIKQYTSLGSGFKIAMRDLEIRGAGNLLGLQQSGHITAVGFDLYCKLLKQSVSKLQGKPGTRRTDVAVHVDFLSSSESAYLKAPDGGVPSFIPSGYMADPTQRIAGYRDLAEAATLKELKAIARTWKDRFGTPPEPAETLLDVTELRIRAAHAGISVVEVRGEKFMLTRNGDFILLNGRFPRLAAADQRERLREAIAMVKGV